MAELVPIALGALTIIFVVLWVIPRVVREMAHGRQLPPVPGPLGAKLKAAKSALVYFTSPECGACRPWTPKIKELGKRNRNVFLVDVSKDIAVARALSVMATPTTIEIRDGQVHGVHVGPIPRNVLERFG
jgi:thiol-disulfide isomerase/thioredoxin